MSAEISQKDLEARIKKMTLIGVVVFLAAYLLFSSVYTIGAGYRGVLLTWGKASNQEVTEGLHMKVPFAQKVVTMSVQTQKYSSKASAASKDMQKVTTELVVNYHVIPDQVPVIYTKIGTSFEDRVIQPAVEEALKATTAKYNAEELITKRQEVKIATEDALKERMRDRGIEVETISITDFQFSPEFAEAIERKSVATQDLQEAMIKKDTATVQAATAKEVAMGIKDANIENAKGEAEAIRTINLELAKSPHYLQWKQVDAWEKGGSQMPQALAIGSGGANPPFIFDARKK